MAALFWFGRQIESRIIVCLSQRGTQVVFDGWRGNGGGAREGGGRAGVIAPFAVAEILGFRAQNGGSSE